MTNKEKNIEDELRARQPFRVPEGYFEGFTDDFMCRLPQKAAPEAKVINFYGRIKPWLYMAAMFAGIIILFNVYHKPAELSDELNPDFMSINVDLEEGDDEEFLEIFEEMYVDKYLFSYIDDYLD